MPDSKGRCTFRLRSLGYGDHRLTVVTQFKNPNWMYRNMHTFIGGGIDIVVYGDMNTRVQVWVDDKRILDETVREYAATPLYSMVKRLLSEHQLAIPHMDA